jgi:hypothetical protein
MTVTSLVGAGYDMNAFASCLRVFLLGVADTIA